ncbi:MAG: hypothetical protein KDJ37_05560 [Hyphomicrobiaceae bacterium]|nr:hypothetical protein [Hyphomicrobiaceae bacterium]
MFDISRLTDFFSGIAEHTQNLAPDSVMQKVSELGIDPTMLQSIGFEDLLAQLSELGIDPAAMDAQQLGDIASRLGEGTPVAELIQQLTGGEGTT